MSYYTFPNETFYTELYWSKKLRLEVGIYAKDKKLWIRFLCLVGMLTLEQAWKGISDVTCRSKLWCKILPAFLSFCIMCLKDLKWSSISTQETCKNLMRSSPSLKTSIRLRKPITRRQAGSWMFILSWWISWFNISWALFLTSLTIFYKSKAIQFLLSNCQASKLMQVARNQQYCILHSTILLTDDICLSSKISLKWKFLTRMIEMLANFFSRRLA